MRLIILGGAFGNDRLPFFYEEIKDNIIYNSLSVIFYIFGKKKANFELMHVYEELQMENKDTAILYIIILLYLKLSLIKAGVVK